MASQTADTVMIFTDRLILSYIGKVYLAAALSGGLSSFVFSSLFSGTVGYVNAFCSQYHGAGQKNKALGFLAQGLWLSLFFYPLVLLFIPAGKFLFTAAGHSQAQLVPEYTYFLLLMTGSIFGMMRVAFAGYFIGTGRPRVVMKVSIAGMLINIPLVYVFVFGIGFFPKLGIAGSAVGTVIASAIMVLFFTLALFKDQAFKDRVAGVFRPRIDDIKKLIRYGLPSGVEVFIAVLGFNVFVQLMHSYNANVAAAVTIALNYDLVAFVPLLGFGSAATMLVGNFVGAEDIPGAKKAVKYALLYAYGYAALMMCVFVFGAPILVKFFSGGLHTEDTEVAGLAIIMLRLASIYTLADATNIVFSGALRGAGDTRWVMIVMILLNWVMAGGGFVLIKIVKAPPLVVWIFFICVAVSIGLSMFTRYRYGKWEKMSLIKG